MAGKFFGTLHKGESITGEILEIAPGDRYQGCIFRECEFTGCGLARFIRCTFVKCGGELQQFPRIDLDGSIFRD